MSVLDSTYHGIIGQHTSKAYDILLDFYPPAADGTPSVPADGTASVVLNLGTGLVDADLILDVTVSTGAGNSILIEFSADEAFTTPVAGPVTPIAAYAAPARVVVPFRNAPDNLTPLPYVRVTPTMGSMTLAGVFVAKK